MNTKTPTVLTNLQRGNVKQESPMLHPRSIHELAAQGELYHLEPHMIDTVDSNNMTPLLWAAGYGQVATVDFLLRSGANPNHRAKGGKTALMYASSRGFFRVVKNLVSDGANVNDVDDTGCSALMYAVYQDHPSVIQELLRNGADLGTTNALGRTAYGIALTKNNKSQVLIEAHLISVFKRHNVSLRIKH